MTLGVFGPNVGGGAVPIVPFRRDHSVNGAWVDGFQNAAGPTGPIFRTQTNANPAGSYTGGGTGNKAILGKTTGGAPIPLGTLLTMEWTVTRLQPEGASGPGIQLPYANLIVDLGAPPIPPTPPPATPGPLVLLVFGDALNALPLGTYSAPSASQLKATWSAATDRVLVVFGKGMQGFPNPPGPATVASPEPWPVTPNGNTPLGEWQNHSYTIAAILGAYPGAMIVDADPIDGGMPLATILAGRLLVYGDSANKRQGAARLDSWKINGAEV